MALPKTSTPSFFLITLPNLWGDVPTKVGTDRLKKSSAGFTLIEILVVMALMIFIAGFALVISLDTYRSYNFRNDQSLLLGVILKARSQAMANINQENHGVHLDQTAITYTLFQAQGTTFTGRPAADTGLDIVFSGNSSYSLTTSLTGGVTDLIFFQLTGRPSATGGITLDDHVHPKYTICINSEGQINVKATCP